MNDHETRSGTRQQARETGQEQRGGRAGHGHGWMMIACCIPMLAIAIALVAIGVVGPVFILVALVCTALMAFMMRGASRGDDGKGSRR